MLTFLYFLEEIEDNTNIEDNGNIEGNFSPEKKYDSYDESCKYNVTLVLLVAIEFKKKTHTEFKILHLHAISNILKWGLMKSGNPKQWQPKALEP